jgi:rhamnosyltransferase
MKKIAVLMPVFNGEQFLAEQISSIFSQIDVSIDLYISDDGSTDGTLDVLNTINFQYTLVPRDNACGSAGLSFLQLIYDVDFSGYNFVAFADQDDIWLPAKLSRAVDMLVKNSADGYSANDIAFWPDGRCVTSIKSLPQKKYDHYFESIGRGCTYCICSSALQRFKEEVLANGVPQISHVMHDWLIYAYFRERDLQWFADDYVALLYRQHFNNALGVNSGFRAIVDRFKLMRNGWYMQEISNIFELVKPKHGVRQILSKTWMIKNFSQLRRSLHHRIFLVLFCLFFKL